MWFDGKRVSLSAKVKRYPWNNGSGEHIHNKPTIDIITVQWCFVTL